MQIDVQELLNSLDTPAIFCREYTIRYYNELAQSLFPTIRVGRAMPDGYRMKDSPFQMEEHIVSKGSIFLFRPRMEERAAGDMQAVVRELRASVSVLMAAEERTAELLRDYGEAEGERLMRQVDRNLFALRRLCDHIDLLRELESGRRDVYREGPVDLTDVCRRIGEQVTGLLEQSGVKFRLDCTQESLLTMGDSLMLQRMILNLLSNAIKAAGPGGEVGLRLERQRERALFSIWDNGAGIEIERMGNLFRPQRRKGVPKPEDGAGVGLRLAREVAVLHGGVILAEARTGGGAKITASIPLKPVKSRHMRSAATWQQETLSLVMVELSDALPAEAYSHWSLEG